MSISLLIANKKREEKRKGNALTLWLDCEQKKRKERDVLTLRLTAVADSNLSITGGGGGIRIS